MGRSHYSTINAGSPEKGQAKMSILQYDIHSQIAPMSYIDLFKFLETQKREEIDMKPPDKQLNIF